MNFEFSEEQRAIRDAVARTCARFGGDYWLHHDRDGGFPHEFHAAIAADGWLGIAMPEAHGGSGLGIREEQLIEIAHAEKHQRIRMRGLGDEPLRHGRRGAAGIGNRA
jgi:alkylation response protein AidB-like acyl-CoA dehydrogenase